MIPTPPLTARDYSSDAGLAQRVASGEREAQHELFRALKHGVHATLYRVLGSNEHMEDLLQDSFIEIFRSIGGYRGESQLATWAARISARVAFHHLKRKRSRRDDERAPVQLHVVGSPEDHAQHREGLKRLYGLLRRMKPDDHIALALFVMDGRSMEEIAEITGVTVVAAKSRVSRARRKLWDAARRDQVLTTYLGEQGAAE
jgi:RNA polymerase sigma-70 factor, ECF subfamily